MGKADIIAKLYDKDQQHHAAFETFVGEMKHRQYGTDEVNDAWFWFCAGWDLAESASQTAGKGSR